MRKLIDLTGQRFGRWLVLKRTSNDKRGEATWLCRCDCGEKKIVRGGTLRDGDSKGCYSCYNRYAKSKHGQTGTPLYQTWQAMIQRCEYPNRKGYKNYGGRGIKVYPGWRKDFIIFRTWALSHGYRHYLTIDRIDNGGDYSPDNCRFVTMAIQNRNSRNNRLVRIGNETKLLVEWAEQTGINYNTLWRRLNVGWPEDRLLEPARAKQAVAD